jgi:hypothetical protein
MRIALLLAALGVLQASSALAQSAPLACNGDIAVVRVSAIKPGAMPGFLAAVAAHNAWYRSHGFNGNAIFVSRVILADPKTGAMKYSDTEVVTYHVRPPSGKETAGKRDAAWSAYVKQYQDTSEIRSSYVTCMPKFAPQSR